MRRVFRQLSVTLAGALATIGAATAAVSGELPLNYQNTGANGSGQSADARNAVRTMLNSSINYMLPALGENAPEVLKRIEFDSPAAG